MQAKPTLAEWRVANPGKSVNDYYAEHGHAQQAVPIPSLQPTYQPLSPPAPQVVYVERQNSFDMFGLLVSCVALLAYFLPWISVDAVLGKIQFGSYSASNFPNLLNSLARTGGESLDDETRLWMMTPWLLVLLPVSALVCAMAKLTTVKVMAQFLYMAIAAYWLYQVYSIDDSIGNYKEMSLLGINFGPKSKLETGFYLAGLAALLMGVDAALSMEPKGK